MSNARRAHVRRTERARQQLKRTVEKRTEGRTPTEQFGRRLDETAEAQGERVRIARTFSFRHRVIVVYRFHQAQ